MLSASRGRSRSPHRLSNAARGKRSNKKNAFGRHMLVRTSRAGHSPFESAKNFKIGQRKRGNDKKTWYVVNQRSNGSKYWLALKKKKPRRLSGGILVRQHYRGSSRSRSRSRSRSLGGGRRKSKSGARSKKKKKKMQRNVPAQLRQFLKGGGDR